MQIISSPIELQTVLAERRNLGFKIGLVPTMGALHEGHISLIRQARLESELVVVSIFVNPTQFTEQSDLESYPRDLEKDKLACETAQVDILFTPTPEDIYQRDFDTVVVVRSLSNRLEGASRPGHFTGVATIVTKLLCLTRADKAFFGEKDWQQLQIIKRLTIDLNIRTEIIGVPTMREPDGLAMSSRNALLTNDQRQAAVSLASALTDTQAIADTGVQDAYQLAAWLRQTITVQPLARLDYAVVVDPETLQEIDTIEHGGLAAVACYFGNVRLIDNRMLQPYGSYGMRR